MTVTASALDWLLDSDEPGIVFQAKRDLLAETDPPEAAHVLDGPRVRTLLAGQRADGGFGVNVYGKWGGAHWRLVSLVELGVPAGEPRCVAAAETVLAWLTGEGHRKRIPTIDGLVRRCGSQEGNALAVCCRLGLAEDPRVRLLAESLVEWQWPDGGWNCDKNATGYRSSFNESPAADVGLARVLGRDRRGVGAGGGPPHGGALPRAPHLPGACDRRADPSVVRDAPLSAFLALRLPPGAARPLAHGDRRRPARPGCRRASGGAPPPGRPLAPGGRWWRPPGSKGANVEVVDWGSGPNELLTLNALRVLHAAAHPPK